jgi:hypothetical protein
MERLRAVALGAAMTAVAGIAAGCTAHAATPSAPADPAAQLAQAAGRLDGTNTFRLTVDTLIPQGSAASATSSPTGAPAAGPSKPVPTESVKMSGVWDIATRLARMDGTLNAVRTTILSSNGVEYVSLTPDVVGRSGKKWLKSDDSNATFGDFCDPHLVAQLLRAFHAVHEAGSRHLSGTIETAEADRHIADPNLVASLAGYPSVIRFDLFTDGSGAATRVLFTLSGPGAVTTGTAQLDAFGTTPAQVSVPTIDQVVQAPAG